MCLDTFYVNLIGYYDSKHEPVTVINPDSDKEVFFFKVMMVIRRKGVRKNGLQRHVKNRVVLKPVHVQQKNIRTLKTLTRQILFNVIKGIKRIRRKKVKRTDSKMHVLFLVVTINLMILTLVTNPIS